MNDKKKAVRPKSCSAWCPRTATRLAKSVSARPLKPSWDNEVDDESFATPVRDALIDEGALPRKGRGKPALCASPPRGHRPTRRRAKATRAAGSALSTRGCDARTIQKLGWGGSPETDPGAAKTTRAYDPASRSGARQFDTGREQIEHAD